MSANRNENQNSLETYFAATQSIFHTNIIQNLMCLNRNTLQSLLDIQEKRFYENLNNKAIELEYDFAAKLLELKDIVEVSIKIKGG